MASNSFMTPILKIITIIVMMVMVIFFGLISMYIIPMYISKFVVYLQGKTDVKMFIINGYFIHLILFLSIFLILMAIMIYILSIIKNPFQIFFYDNLDQKDKKLAILLLIIILISIVYITFNNYIITDTAIYKKSFSTGFKEEKYLYSDVKSISFSGDKNFNLILELSDDKINLSRDNIYDRWENSNKIHDIYSKLKKMKIPIKNDEDLD